MADNRLLQSLSGPVAVDEVTYSGDTLVALQLIRLVRVTGAEGSKVVSDVVAGAAALSNIAALTSSQTLQAANALRLGLIIFNDSTANLFVKYGTGATNASFTHKLGPGESLRETLYTGIVTGVWESANGNARMTEMTAS